jgi:hypothetical protein
MAVTERRRDDYTFDTWIDDGEAYYDPDKKNFYSMIRVDSNHLVEIAFDKEYSHDFEYIGTIWYITKYCIPNNDRSCGCVNCVKSFGSFTRAKVAVFKMVEQSCHLCYDEHGNRRRDD